MKTGTAFFPSILASARAPFIRCLKALSASRPAFRLNPGCPHLKHHLKGGRRGGGRLIRVAIALLLPAMAAAQQSAPASGQDKAASPASAAGRTQS